MRCKEIKRELTQRLTADRWPKPDANQTGQRDLSALLNLTATSQGCCLTSHIAQVRESPVSERVKDSAGGKAAM